MTKQNAPTIILERDRPTDLEISPEMIEAGTEALEPFYMGDGVYDLREPCLTAVYRAMREFER